MSKDDISDLELYLYFSYLPKFSDANLDWLHCDYSNDFGRGINEEAWWIREGVQAWKETMLDQVSGTRVSDFHIILLSGGMDSRAILGGLLENLPKSRIIAATYGIPGAWDFEFGKVIAQKYGIKHEAFNLLDEKWDMEELVVAASYLKNPVNVYQSYIRQKVNQHFGTQSVYWSGFLGDAIGGYGIPRVPSTDKREAVTRYINIEPTPHYKDRTFQIELIEKICNEIPWENLYHRKFSIDQQLLFSLKQRCLLQPIVVVNGFNFKTPFLSKRWIDFMSCVPYQWLLDLDLYRKIIMECYNKLSILPIPDAAGGPFYASKQEVFVRRIFSKIKPYLVQKDPYRSHPRTNYINWTESLRHKSPLQETVYITLQDLKKRAIFENKDLDMWWHDHLNKKMDYTILLMNLSSLELLLKTGVM
jgi:hypothetical protein